MHTTGQFPVFTRYVDPGGVNIHTPLTSMVAALLSQIPQRMKLLLLLPLAAEALALRGCVRRELPQLRMASHTGAPRRCTRAHMVATAAATSPAAMAAVSSSDEWIDNLDMRAFGAEVRDLGKRMAANEGDGDLRHFEKMRRWSNAFGILGVATMALPANPVSIFCLSTYIYSRWAMIAHHTCHGGYDRHRLPHFSGRTFALGGPLHRARDWLDWMLPEAWNHEHNVLHHYQLGERGDPDLVERNLGFVRAWPFPVAVKLAFVVIMSSVWKWVYYAPNTYKQLKLSEYRKAHGGSAPPGLDAEAALTLGKLLRSNELRGGLFKPAEFLLRVFAPVVAFRFLLLPAPLLLLPGTGRACFVHAVTNLVLADMLSNVHAFATIVTNHAGSDLYRFETSCAPNSAEFLSRAVLSSANYPAGATGTVRGDLNDFFHGFLNYQAEHHCWPNLSMLSYQRAAPQLKSICQRHGVPYTCENVLVRTRKTVAIMVGVDSMKVWPDERVGVATR